VDLRIDWSGNPGIGQYDQSKNFKAENPKKAFYNDAYKLLTLFPVNLASPKIVKDAPFDVTESKLDNTFFNRWDSIKNNVILHWVDLEDKNGDYGMALLTDHTTSYAFGNDHPLGLTIQYSGKGLWGRDYKITGPTTLRYALIPHAGKWDKAGISNLSNQWNEPLTAVVSSENAGQRSRSWLTMPEGWELSTLQKDGEDILLRILNGAGTEGKAQIMIDGTIKQATLVELNGEVIRNAPVTQRDGKTLIELSLPRFGIRTLRMKTQ
jgi:alpha-mannosidase